MMENFQFKYDATNLISSSSSSLSLAEDEDGQPFLYGIVNLIDNKGDVFDKYHIKITSSKKYPFRFPHVYEIGGRIPINIDWHVFPDGYCCIKALVEEILLCKNGINLHDFIDKQVIPYFYNQSFRESYGYFLNERSHGQLGNIEFFYDIFKTKDTFSIYKYLSFIASRNEPNRVSKCFCGSRNKYRHCHRDAFRLLNSLSDDELSFFQRIILSN